MEISTTNVFTLLYKWFYNTKKLPNNLCPYFWALLFAVLFSIPFILYSIPGVILLLFSKNKKYVDNDRQKHNIIAILLLIFLASFICAILLWSMGSEGVNSLVAILGVTGSFIIAFILILGSVILIVEYNKNKVITTNNGTIIGNFIKAKYNKYCPIITWKNSK